MRILVLEALETLSLQRRLLRVADRRFNFPLQIGSVGPARQRNDAVVFEQLGVERIKLRVPNVRLENAFFEVVEPDRVRGAAEVRERFLVQPAPNLRRRFPNNFAKRVAAVTECHHEEPGLSVFAGARIACRRPPPGGHLKLYQAWPLENVPARALWSLS